MDGSTLGGEHTQAPVNFVSVVRVWCPSCQELSPPATSDFAPVGAQDPRAAHPPLFHVPGTGLHHTQAPGSSTLCWKET